MIDKKYVYAFTTLAILATLVTTPVFASTTTTNKTAPKGNAWGNQMGGGKDHKNVGAGVFGTVSAVSGYTITVTGKQNYNKTTTTTATTTSTVTYTIDATNAKITKNNTAGTIDSILVGDNVMIQGTITGTNVVATTIRDGKMAVTKTGVDSKTTTDTKTSPITGNGQPVIAGTVSTISGSTLTITNKSNITYTVDITNAKIVKGQNTITISDIAVGDAVVVQGTINGTSVTASSVIDQNATTTTTTTTAAKAHRGFFGSIGSFFSSLFGF
jgi:hypothetical protein